MQVLHLEVQFLNVGTKRIKVSCLKAGLYAQMILVKLAKRFRLKLNKIAVYRFGFISAEIS